MDSNSTSSSGVGFTSLLALLFIGLKLGGVLHWSWLWVLLPLWGGIALVLFVFLMLAVVRIFRSIASWYAKNPFR